MELPEGSSSDNKWKRLDRFGPWDEFKSAFTNSNDNDNNLLERIDEFEPTDVVAIDWHGMLAWQAIIASSTTTTMYNRWRKGQVSVCYYNFRVYSSSSWGNDDDDAQFYQAMEQLACRMADGIICLSEHDKCALQQFLMQSDVIEEEKYTIPSGCQERKRREMTVLPPPLRGDVCELARMMTYPPIEQSSSSSLFDEYLPEQVREALDYIQLQTQSTTTNHHQQRRERVFLTCISRLSPEKTPHIFVNLLQQLGGVTFLRKHGLIPILCGARSVESYAEVVIQSLRNVCSTEDGGDEDDNYWRPCIVIDHHHLGPKELASIFSHTILNVHPCLYDAYGMTMVESSAFGVPSVVNCGGKVGAAALLGEGLGCVALDLSGLDYDDEEEVVTGSGKAAAVAVASCSAARGGDEEEMDCSVKKVKEMLAPRIEQGDDLLESNDSSSSSSTLARVAKEARQRALGWDELSCSRGLLEKLNSLRIKTDEVERS